MPSLIARVAARVPAPRIILHSLKRTVEVVIPEAETLAGPLEVELHSLANGGVILFVQHLVRLQVQAPIAAAAFEREVRLPREHFTAEAHIRVPEGAERADLRLMHRLHKVPGDVIALADIENDLVDQRQHRAKTGLDRVAELHGVIGDAEAADAHRYPATPCAASATAARMPSQKRSVE